MLNLIFEFEYWARNKFLSPKGLNKYLKARLKVTKAIDRVKLFFHTLGFGFGKVFTLDDYKDKPKYEYDNEDFQFGFKKYFFFIRPSLIRVNHLQEWILKAVEKDCKENNRTLFRVCVIADDQKLTQISVLTETENEDDLIIYWFETDKIRRINDKYHIPYTKNN